MAIEVTISGGLADLEFKKNGNNLIITNRNKNTQTLENYFLESERDKEFVINSSTYTLDWLKFPDYNEYAMFNIATNQSQVVSGFRNWITTGDDADSIVGGDFEDYIDGGAGNDTIYGGEDYDTIYGGDGADVIYGEDGDDEIYGNGGNDSIYGGSGDEYIEGGSGNDTIEGAGGDDYINGGEGDDLIYVNGGENDLYGGLGNDTIYGAGKHDYIVGGIGNDELYGGAGSDQIYGEDGDDLINGDDGNDTIRAGLGNDEIHGGKGNDLIYGEVDDDTIYGGEGNDTIYGGDGHDTVDGSDVIYGDEGNDTFIVTGVQNNVLLKDANSDDKLVHQVPSHPDINFESFKFTKDGNNLVISLDSSEAGQDTHQTMTLEDHFTKLADGTQLDKYVVGETEYSLLKDATINVVVSEGETYTATGYKENITFTGNSQLDFEAGCGDKTITLGDNDFSTVLNYLPYNYSEGVISYSLYSIEEKADGSIVLTRRNLHMVGDDYEMKLDSTDTLTITDYIANGREKVTFKGNIGSNPYNNYRNDLLENIIRGTYSTDYIVMKVLNIPEEQEFQGTWLSEILQGTNQDDTIYGNDGNDTIHGGAGDDIIYGGAGNNDIHGGDGNDLIYSGGDSNIISRQYGDAGNDTIYGDNSNNGIYGGDGNDSIDGGAGNDSLDGGAGDDILYGGAGNDLFVYYGGHNEGNDIIKDACSDDKFAIDYAIGLTFTRNGNDLVITNGTGDYGQHTITLEDHFTKLQNNTQLDEAYINRSRYLLSENATINVTVGEGETYAATTYKENITITGDNQIDFAPGCGDKTITLGDNDFSTVLNYLPYNYSEGVISYSLYSIEEKADGSIVLTRRNLHMVGDDYEMKLDSTDTLTITDYIENGKEKVTFKGNIGYKASLTNDLLENIIGNKIEMSEFNIPEGQEFQGTWLSEKLNGTNQDDIIYGNDGDDTINGGIGNDTIYGKDGNDSINGGNGNDSIYGDAGNDTLNGGAGNDSIYGGADNDAINGDAGNDTIYGDVGNDTIYGGAGDDYIEGGAGSDNFSYYGLGHNEGNDIIKDACSEDKFICDYANMQDLTLSRDGDNLIITNGSGNQQHTVTLEDHFKKLADGTQLDEAWINRSKYSLLNDFTINVELNDNEPYNVVSNTQIDFEAGCGDKIITLGDNEFSTLLNFVTDETEGHYSTYSLEQKADGSVVLKRDNYDGDTLSGTDTLTITDYIANGKGKVTFNGVCGSDTESTNTLLENAIDQEKIDMEPYTIPSNNYEGNWLSEKLNGTDLDDTINGSDGNDYINGGVGNEKIYGNLGNDTIQGGVGNDTIYGDAGDDEIYGGADNDQIYGGVGNDTIYGGDGNDTFVVDGSGVSNDLIKDACSDDTLEYKSGSEDMTFTRNGNDLVITSGSEENQKTVTLEDHFTKLKDGTQLDKYVVGETEHSLLKDATINVVVSEGETYTATGYKEVITGSGTVNGLTSDDKLVFTGDGDDYKVDYKKSGNNLIIGDGTNEITVVDYFKAGNTFDTVNVNGTDVSIKETVPAFTVDMPDGKSTFNGTNENEKIDASLYTSPNGTKGVTINSKGGNDDITGSEYNDVIKAGTGDNKIEESSGDNKITVGNGDNSIRVYDYSSNTIKTGSGNNSIELESIGKNKVYAKKGADSIRVTEGSNTIKAGNGDNVIKVNAEITRDENGVITGIVVGDEPNSLNKITTGKNNDTFALGGGNNNIKSGSGNDIFYIEDGYNVIKSTGYATYNVDGGFYNKITSGKKKDIFNITDGKNVINSGSGHDEFTVSGGDNNLSGGNGNDTFYINGGQNRVNGGKGNDTFVVTKGSDTLIGGKGNDVYDFSKYEDSDAVVTINDTSGKNSLILTDKFDVKFDVTLKKVGKANKYTIGKEVSFIGDDLEIDVTGKNAKSITTVTVTDESTTPTTYSFNVSKLAADVASWLSTTTYKSTAAVFEHGTDTEIAQLNAIFAGGTDKIYTQIQ